jgi:hypothetical protein
VDLKDQKIVIGFAVLVHRGGFKEVHEFQLVNRRFILPYLNIQRVRLLVHYRSFVLLAQYHQVAVERTIDLYRLTVRNGSQVKLRRMLLPLHLKVNHQTHVLTQY